MAPQRVVLDGRSLALDHFLPLFSGPRGDGALGPPVEFAIAPAAAAAVQRARELVLRQLDRGLPVYGLNTGFGRLKNVAIGRQDLATLQRNLVLSHCCGVGEPLPRAEVRAAMVLRLNGLCRGHSGVRLERLEQWLRLLHRDFVPYVPQQGSVGASGDLAPLAHLAAATLGHGRAYLGDQLLDAAVALRRLGEEPQELEAKEGLALINGTEVMKAIGVGVTLRATRLSRAADVLCALSLEGLQGSLTPFDPRFAELKGHAGHARTAANVRACLAGSAVLASHRDCDRVQDPYSLRCVPQIHGAFKAALEHVREVLSGELNSVTDNPILFPDTGEILSAGQFHGQPIAMVLDYLGLALCTLANVSERRIEQLVNPDLSRLPPFLTPAPGLNSGLMIAQVAAAALASENKVLAHPASVDTVPTSANQEDHVSMGVTAARKARTIAENVERVLAIEYLCAAQAREFHRELRAGPGAEAAHQLLREHVPALVEDRFLADDIETARGLIASGALESAVSAALGAPLEA
jgi:histidine ammonia-lyase